MVDVQAACDYVLKHEDSTLSGVITKDPTKADPQAVARFGVNSAANPHAVEDGFFEMPREAALQYAEDVIKYDYFSRIGGDAIVDQSIANKFTDLAFNCGVQQATAIVQRAVNSVLGNLVVGLKVDGIPGSRTLVEINACEPERLLPAIKEKAKEFYVTLASKSPQHEKDLAGWLARVDS